MTNASPSTNPADREPNPAREPVAQPSVPTISADKLLRGHREIAIVHGDAVYRLRVTRNGKLILQK
jgi:hemin uptake protein HemP